MVMPEDPGPGVLLNVLYLVCRYMHIVGGMLLVGGIVFYETVVPIAISELKAEAQLAIFARARWVFRWVVWWGAGIIVLSGVFMSVWKLNTYIGSEFLPQLPYLRQSLPEVPWPLRTGLWWAAHMFAALLAISVAAHMVSGDRPPRHPVSWLRLDLMVLLVVVFLATVTHQVDQIHHDRAVEWIYSPLIRLVDTSQDADAATQPTAPATAPTNAPAP